MGGRISEDWISGYWNWMGLSGGQISEDWISGTGTG